ncbi:csdA Selenocysteine lyase/Cysteine desulfurase [Candidatus Nanopelagicaceae bacterium]|jgi:cysteine desulfurase/selenocysteine lyase
MSLDVARIRKDFPIFTRTIRDGKKLVYLDSGATSQKPQVVIDAEVDFYAKHNAAAHRGAHQLAEEATEMFEASRETVASFLGAKTDEIVFTKSATESLNLLAYAFSNAEPGSQFAISSEHSIVVSEMEHHANLIPWQQLAKRSGAELKWFGVTSDGRLDESNIDSLITSKTKIVAITQQSNVLGTINNLERIIEKAHKFGAIVIVDACQSVPHLPVDVTTLGADFLAFSGHKILGPTGVGVLWGRYELLNDLPPFLFGGSMIENVTMTDATWAEAPRKFEAGVPNMAQVIGLAAGIKYLQSIGLDAVHEHETALTGYLLKELNQIPGIAVVGPTDISLRGGTVSFTLDGVHPHDLGQYLDSAGIAVRTGHHCAWPLTRALGVPATTRASLYLYNDNSDIDALIAAIKDAKKYFGQ